MATRTTTMPLAARVLLAQFMARRGDAFEDPVAVVEALESDVEMGYVQVVQTMWRGLFADLRISGMTVTKTAVFNEGNGATCEVHKVRELRIADAQTEKPIGTLRFGFHSPDDVSEKTAAVGFSLTVVDGWQDECRQGRRLRHLTVVFGDPGHVAKPGVAQKTQWRSLSLAQREIASGDDVVLAQRELARLYAKVLLDGRTRVRAYAVRCNLAELNGRGLKVVHQDNRPAKRSRQ